jgi:hypothetical protein
MSFRIEIESFHTQTDYDPEDTTVSEAIETVYREGPGVRIHMGPGTWVSLPTYGGISDIYSYIVRMLTRIEVGVYPFDIYFLSSGFTTIWSFHESAGILTILISWTAVNGVFNGRSVMNAQFNDVVPQLVIEKELFVNEWQGLLRKVKCNLLSAGYANRLSDFEYMASLNDTAGLADI